MMIHMTQRRDLGKDTPRSFDVKRSKAGPARTDNTNKAEELALAHQHSARCSSLVDQPGRRLTKRVSFLYRSNDPSHCRSRRWYKMFRAGLLTSRKALPRTMWS